MSETVRVVKEVLGLGKDILGDWIRAYLLVVGGLGLVVLCLFLLRLAAALLLTSPVLTALATWAFAVVFVAFVVAGLPLFVPAHALAQLAVVQPFMRLIKIVVYASGFSTLLLTALPSDGSVPGENILGVCVVSTCLSALLFFIARGSYLPLVVITCAAIVRFWAPWAIVWVTTPFDVPRPQEVRLALTQVEQVAWFVQGPDGRKKPAFWYGVYRGRIRLFDRRGIDPETGDRVQPVDLDIKERYLLQLINDERQRPAPPTTPPRVEATQAPADLRAPPASGAAAGGGASSATTSIALIRLPGWTRIVTGHLPDLNKEWREGDRFRANLVEPIEIDYKTVARENAEIECQITEASPHSLGIRAISFMADNGQRVPVQTEITKVARSVGWGQQLSFRVVKERPETEGRQSDVTPVVSMLPPEVRIVAEYTPQRPLRSGGEDFRVGDTFRMKLEEPIVVGDRTLCSAGAEATAQVVAVSPHAVEMAIINVVSDRGQRIPTATEVQKLRRPFPNWWTLDVYTVRPEPAASKLTGMAARPDAEAPSTGQPSGGTRDSRDEGVAVEPKAAGRLRLEVRPEDAHVYVDGRFRGSAGQSVELVLPPGRHRLEFVRPGYRPEEREVKIEAGRVATLALKLERP